MKIETETASPTALTTAEFCARLPVIAQAETGAHPFSKPLSFETLQTLLPQYLAMSQAFPYLLAGAQKESIFAVMERNLDVPAALELTSAVAYFLCWDEAGGHAVTLRHGNAGLERILETDRRFHANLLRRDAERILDQPVRPNYSPATRQYLTRLHQCLSSTDAVRRCASLVSFEMHAGVMITALWQSIAAVGALPADELAYFRVHVGGSDPAEKYHEDMTQRLIERLVLPAERARFLDEFLSAYRDNVGWCQCLVQAPSPAAAPDLKWYHGGCHCGGVRFRVRAPAALAAVRCNCSICAMTQFLHLLVPAQSFELLEGESLLSTYRFNTHTAQHTFCSRCGVKPFYRPRSNPQDYSVNVHCLDRWGMEQIEISDFDGQHWEQSIDSLQHAEQSVPKTAGSS